MKLKIVFCEPPLKAFKAAPDEKLVIIPSPYQIIQNKSGDTREYAKLDGSKMPTDFTYEHYCQEMVRLIHQVLDESNLSQSPYDQLIIEGFSQPPNFKSLCSKLAQIPMSFAASSKILFKNCAFGGKLYTDSASLVIRSLQKRHTEEVQEKLRFQIGLVDTDKVNLSKHDEARLAILEDVVFRKHNGAKILPAVRDDSLIGVKKTPLLSSLDPPTLFYSGRKNTFYGQTTAEIALKHFFSQEAQQQNDYTCGPATVRMVADYFDSMHRQDFCEAPVAHPDLWHQMNQTPEMVLAEQVNTTEAEGSAISDIRHGLMKMGLTVFDDNGLSNKEHKDETLNTHKQVLWDTLHQILKLGIPIILNMQDRTGCGHYEVVIGIEKSRKNEHIILAEPGTALVGKLEFEHIPKNEFIARWKNMSGEFHGRFMVLSPNEASTHALDSILAKLPHYKNGEEVNRSSTELKI